MERLKNNPSNQENHPLIAGFFLPSSEYRNTLLSYPDQILYAGESPRRIAFIKKAFCDREVVNFAVGEEPNEKVEDVAKFKIETGKKYLNRSICTAIIAADTQTIVPEIIGNQVNETNKGKPKYIKDVYDSFANIYLVAKKTGDKPYYRVDSASALFHNCKIGESHIIEKDSCTVFLDESSLYYLLHPNGFQKYLDEFRKFYSSNSYKDNGMKAISPHEISGGISLPVLTKMGIVKSIQDVHSDNEKFKDVLKKNIHLVAVGISPKLLDTMQLNTQETIDNWSWLEEISTNAIKTI